METLNQTNVSEEQMLRAFELLNKENVRKDKIARGEIKGSRKWSELTDEQKETHKQYNKMRTAKINKVYKVAQDIHSKLMTNSIETDEIFEMLNEFFKVEEVK